MSRIAIGIDYGTLSARAVAIDVDTGELKGSSTYVYPHGVIEEALPDNYALAHPTDYKEALINIIKGCKVNPDEVIGVGLDVTTYTLVPCDEHANVMAEHEEHKNEPMAYIKLWKHHAATKQAEKIQAVHEKTGGFPAINRIGGVITNEWAMPKLLETYEKAPKLWQDTYQFCDLGEWLCAWMTGKFTGSLHAMHYKSLYAEDLGYPNDEALDMLSPGFANGLKEKYWKKPVSHYEACGRITNPELGLNIGTPVAGSFADGSIPGIYFCVDEPDTLAITYGTSISFSFVSKVMREMPGIHAVVKDSIIPGYYSYESGQPCAGDMLDWLITHHVPGENVNFHHYLTEKAQEKNPWENKLTVLDWWNGNRGILNNTDLRGAIIGYSLDTRSEDIYCAMLQGIACGTRRIIDYLEDYGITFKKIVFCGGIPNKNAFAMQQYANILGREIYISDADDITAKSSAMLGACAAGIDIHEALAKMKNDSCRIVKPEHIKEYAVIYDRWCKYHDLLKGA